MHDPRWNMSVFWLLVFFSVFLSNVPGIHFLLTPVSQFVTMVHEMGHALVTILTGGHVNFMTVVSDGQGHAGLTGSSGGWAFLSSAGWLYWHHFFWLPAYLPRSISAIFEIDIVWFRHCYDCLLIIFMTPGLLSATFFESIGSLVWGLGMGAFCVYLGKKLQPAWANLVVLF
jgi:hypothetical protein